MNSIERNIPSNEQSFFSRPVLTFLAIGLVAFTDSGLVNAAPLTLTFDANISQVQGDPGSLDLPFPLVVGRPINGKYVFQSEQDLLDIFLDGDLRKQAQVALTIGGVEITAVANFGLINSAGELERPTGPNSSVSLGYLSLTDVFPGWGGYFKNHYWDVGLVLLGHDGTIASTDDILDINKWNQLTTLRHLGLRFGQFEASQFKVVTIEASVGNFSAVPEPACIWLVYSVIPVALAHICFHRIFGSPPTLPNVS
jgi:hypothetical protein